MITLEAMAAGLPVVLTRDGGNLEIVENNVNGYLCENGNIKDYADKICLLMDNIPKMKAISIEAINTIVKGYTTEKMFENYHQIYLELIHNKKRV
jgi:glycosyltransferase involved in cell wall biosynthesis